MPDIPGSAATTVSLASGESLESGIRGGLSGGGARDADWVRLTLEAGETVLITLEGLGRRGLSDPLVRLRDADGKVLEFNDDAGGRDTIDAGLLYTAEAGGLHFIEARAFGKRDSGAYRLSVTEAEPLTDPVAALDWAGARVEEDEVTVRFLPEGARAGGYDSEGFTAYEIARFAAAFAQIETLVPLRFTFTDAPDADFRLLLDRDEIGRRGFLGEFNPPGERGAGVGVFNGAAWDHTPGGDLDRGGAGYVTIVHELLHGLGLAHPHDNGGGSEILSGVSADTGDYGTHGLNQGVFTIMSYNGGLHTGVPGTEPDARDLYGYATGPMALDIAALQGKYGANTETATGRNVYRLPTENVLGTGWETIWDAGGRDVIRASGGRDAVIDLRAATLDYAPGGGGYLSQIAGVAGGVTIAQGVVIERAHGGRGDDILIGNEGRNVLRGGAGDDVLTGGAGRDRLVGGAGRDTFVLTDAADSSGAAYDTIRSFRQGRDRVDLSGIETAADDGGFVFVGLSAFSGTAGELRFTVGAASGGGGSREAWVYGDTDGDGTADLAIRFRGSVGFTGDDFIL